VQTINVIGRIAQKGKLSEDISSDKLQQLLPMVRSNSEESAKHVSLMIYALGNLAEAGRLSGNQISTDKLISLCETSLLSQDYPGSAQDISMALHGFAKLAEAEKLTVASATSDLLSSLFETLYTRQVDERITGKNTSERARYQHGDSCSC
jgi:hypothetical protein